MRLVEFDAVVVEPVLLSGLRDEHEKVRRSARYVMDQFGIIPPE